MEKRFGNNNPDINDYVETLFHPEDKILKEAREQTKKGGLPLIQVGPMDARHLEVITRALGAKKAVEVGTLGGYSGISILRGLSSNGKLYSFEINPKAVEIAQFSFNKAGFSGKYEIILGPAKEKLKDIEKEGPFDLVFLDADKGGYPTYFKWAEKNLRVGGVVLADNVFAWGKISEKIKKGDPDLEDVIALQKFNEEVSQNSNFRTTILPTGEGLLMAVKIH